MATESMGMHPRSDLSQWIDILAGAKCEPEPLDPQPYAVGLFTACITAEDMECDAPLESVASSPGLPPQTCAIDAVWQPFVSSVRDELDELLEELAQDTSCPYLQQLTVPNLMATFLPTGCGAGVSPVLGSGLVDAVHQPPQGCKSQQVVGASSSPEPAADLVTEVKAASFTMLLRCSASNFEPGSGFGPGDKARFPQETGYLGQVQASPASAATAAAEAVREMPVVELAEQTPAETATVTLVTATTATTYMTSATSYTPSAGQPFAAALAALDGSRSGGGGEWGDGGDSQLLPFTLRGARCLQKGVNAVSCASDGRCCPASVLQSPYLHRCTVASVQSEMKEDMIRGCIYSADLADQPSTKDGREQWLFKNLRRLKSIVKLRTSLSSPKQTAVLVDVTVAEAVTVTTGFVEDRSVGGGTAAGASTAALTAAAAASTAGSGFGSAAGAAPVAVMTAMRDTDGPGASNDQCYCKPTVSGDVATAATEALKTQVRLLAARLRAIPSKRRSL